MEQVKFFVKRIVELILTLLLVSFFTFAAFSVIPGDTASVMLGPNASAAQVEALREELGLNRPLPVRYLEWVTGAFTGDLGNSAAYGQPVGKLIAERLPVTLGMSLIALLMVLIVSYPMAVVSGRRPGKAADHVLSVFGHILFALPPFVLSMLIITLAAGLFGILAAGRYVKPSSDLLGFIGCLILPSFCIALPKIAMTFKFLRASVIEENASDYVRTAKSHGLSDASIMMRHVLPNSTVSTITVISLVLSDILGGSLIVEQVFNLPGLGRLLLSAIQRRDFPLMSGMVFYLALITVILYFAADIISAIVDPRMRNNGEVRV
ncbi:MAG: ABC transporter permease [Clostridiales bacterium]|nr:ABC transporter permease [Clostridiales bacterium]HAW15590.1 ABC transporter permease [Clostridiales bacterium]